MFLVKLKNSHFAVSVRYRTFSATSEFSIRIIFDPMTSKKNSDICDKISKSGKSLMVSISFGQNLRLEVALRVIGLTDRAELFSLGLDRPGSIFRASSLNGSQILSSD